MQSNRVDECSSSYSVISLLAHTCTAQNYTVLASAQLYQQGQSRDAPYKSISYRQSLLWQSQQ
eukprot:14645-Heterococcus_DN1.PRE.4